MKEREIILEENRGKKADLMPSFAQNSIKEETSFWNETRHYVFFGGEGGIKL